MVQKNHRTSGIHQAKIRQSLENIYISPLETCNLSCKYCYTKKTKSVLSQSQILKFIKDYSGYLRSSFLQLKSILFCGGEVFILPWFPKLINTLVDQGLFITIITNGTIDKLHQITSPQNCQLIVSIDGPQLIHDQNRGTGNFVKSKKFIKKALKLGFPVELFYLVTNLSYSYIDKFKLLNLNITYLTDRLGSLTQDQILDIKSNYPTYPNPSFGCFQLALQSNGQIYGCCESSIPLASVSDSPQAIINNFLNSLSTCQNCNMWRSEQFFSPQRTRTLTAGQGSPKVARTAKICSQANTGLCLGCCQPDFLCGYTKELGCQNCQQVVVKFNKYAQ